MATVIQIKSSSTANAPATTDLVEAELAYAEDRAGNGAAAVLYISSLNSDNTTEAIHKIGGKYYTDKVDARLIDETSSVGGKLTLAEGTGNGSNKVTIKAADSLSSDVTFTLPSADGSSGYVLTTNGSGVMSFAAPSASSFTLSDGSNTDTFNTGETLTFAGTGGVTPTITNNTVTYALGTVGLSNGGTGKTTAPAAMANLMGYTSTATAGGSTTLTNTSSYYQQFTGSANQTIVLPVTSTLQAGWTFHLVNNSTGTLTVNSSGGNAVITVPTQTTAMVTCIGTSLTTAADWESGLTDFSNFTGSGSVVMATSPTLVTPTLGVASATSVNKVAITAPATSATLTIADGKTLTASNTLTFTGTDSSSVAFGAGGTVAYTGTALSQFASTTSSQLAGVISDETGSGALVFANTPTLVSPLLGTPTSGTLTNCTGLPVATGISGLGTGVATFLATPTSANLASVITDETGSGVVVFGTAPTFTTSIDGGATFAAFASSTALTVGYSSTASSTTNISTGATGTGNTKTVNLGTGAASGSTTNVNIGSANGGTTTVNNNLTVSGDLTVNGTTTTVNSTTISVDDKNIELGSVGTPTDSTADGGGITLKGASDKTFNWINATASWTSSEHLELASGKAYRINGSSVLNATTLGSGVTGSSLTSVGTIGTGVWQGTTVAVGYGGTGATSFTSNGILYGNSTGAIQATAAGTNGYFLYSNSGTPAWTNTISGGTY